MPTKAFISVTSFLIILIMISKFYQEPSPIYQSRTTMKIRDIPIEIEIAKSPEQKQKGLSNRESLGKNEGMLFIESPPGKPGFWMKEMFFSIDIIWIDTNLSVIEITKNISPETYPKIFKPNQDVNYVLEVNGGWAEINDIKPGDKIELPKEIN